MTSFSDETHEHNRLDALRAQDMLDVAPGAAFDRIARIAARTFDVPIAVIALVNATRQWNLAAHGTNVREIDRDVSMAAEAIQQSEITVIEDVQVEGRFSANPLVADKGVRFYAAAPLTIASGHRLGVLAVMDTAPRTSISDAAREALEDLAQMALHEIERRHEHRAHQHRLEQSEQFFLRCPEPLCMASLEGHFLRVNPAFAEATGYTIEELIDRPYLDMVHPEDYEDTVELVNRLAEGEEVDIFTIRVEHKDGSYRWFEWNSLVCERGIIFAAARDITERKAVEEKLMYIQEAVESASDAIAIVRPDGEFVYVNPAFEELFGATRAVLNAMEGAGPHLFADPEQGKEVLKAVRGGEEWTGEIEMKTWEGDTVQIALRGSPITDEEEKVIGIVGIHTDITERKRAEEALMETEKLAATGRMAAGIAHEINNPLAGIKNAFQLVKGSVSPDSEYHHLVGRIEKEIERIRRIVHQMYTLYSPDREVPSRVRLDGLLEDAKLVLEPTAREQQVSIEIGGDTEHEPVWLAEGYLRQVLYNLIMNAIQASPPDDVVSVEIEYEPEHVVIRISDNGPGIAPEIQGQIFEPFFAARGTDTSGLGLGLSISKTLVESMGGTIQFETEPEKGTTFTVRLPKQPPNGPAGQSSSDASGSSSL